MKRCPTCSRTFTDPILSFCTEDGTPLVAVQEDNPADSSGGRQRSEPRDDRWNPAPYQPPGSYTPQNVSKRKTWPLVIGVLALLILVVAGLSIAAALLLPRLSTPPAPNRNSGLISNGNTNSNATVVEPRPNANTSNANTTSNANAVFPNVNVNANVNGNVNANTGVNAAAPFDKDQVLAQLTELEHEWTVANLNADKKALARILADDYVGASANGMQGKVDYIQNVQRDTSIERWDFQDLKVTLHGDRATLSGQLKLLIQGQDRVFNFTDKFVWRDGRWQATGSEVNLVQ